MEFGPIFDLLSSFSDPGGFLADVGRGEAVGVEVGVGFDGPVVDGPALGCREVVEHMVAGDVAGYGETAEVVEPPAEAVGVGGGAVKEPSEGVLAA